MERFLDYGCGDGNASELMANRIERKNWLNHLGGHGWIGIDVNDEYIIKSKEKTSNGSEFVCSDGKHLPFKNRSFSVVHETGALHHMSSYEDGVEEIARVMDNGSCLYMREVVSTIHFIIQSEKW